MDGNGNHCLSAALAARHRERLALELLLWTGLRKSDLITLGPQHRRDGVFYLKHSKNRSETILPVVPAMVAAIEAMTGEHAEHLTYIVTEAGKPFSSAGFGNWFRRKCEAAGLSQFSAHRLRKALSRRVAEAGGTANQGRAVTGHKTDRMFAHYSASADQKALASGILANVSEKFAKPKG